MPSFVNRLVLFLALTACGPSSPRVNELTKPKPPRGEVAPPDAASDPVNLDEDADGIPNAKDGCPTEPEDLDGFKDSDGCPEIDNDADKIPDAADKCPAEPEIYNGKQDEDGCPD